MTGQIRQFDDQPGESRPRPARRGAGPAAQLREKRVHQPDAVGRQAVTDMLEAFCRQLFVALQHDGEQIVLAAKIRIDRALGQPRALRNRSDARSSKSLTPERLIGRVHDASANLFRLGAHAGPPFQKYTGEYLYSFSLACKTAKRPFPGPVAAYRGRLSCNWPR